MYVVCMLAMCLMSQIVSCAANEDIMSQAIQEKVVKLPQKHVYSKVLDNGLTILVRPLSTIPKVTLQIWYNVGSKDEESNEKGIAHLIEHMVFKGTAGKGSLNLSESDINTLMHSLSGSCNAFTSYDYTGYLFNLPKHHWKSILPVMADCMQNCAFKEEHLNSELKAVIQELKMYKDHYTHALVDDIIAMIFTDHPYHDPVIGYKHNLWSLHGEDLRAFYKKHYVPNNATLVVVGDVEPTEVFELAKKYFGAIPSKVGSVRAPFHYTADIASKKLVLYRDIQQPFSALFFVIPGSIKKQDQYIDVVSWLLGSGKGSRLHRILVDEQQLATSFEAFHLDLFEHSLFGFAFEPKSRDDLEKIRTIIEHEINDLISNGFKKGELERAVKNAQVHLYETFENMQQQAYDIGKYFLATGDSEYLFTYLTEPIDVIGKKIIAILKDYFRSVVMHEGMVEPLPAYEREHWLALQAESDREDKEILSARTRETGVELPSYAKHPVSAELPQFAYPKAEKRTLSNGLTLLYYHNPTTPKINVVLEFKGQFYNDPLDKQGLSNFMNRLLIEGSENYTAAEFADELESRGMQLHTYPGSIAISMLSTDFERGLELLYEILTKAIFSPEAIEKVREQILADIKSFWDEPTYFSGQLIKNIVYKNHPYSKNLFGTVDSVKSITRDDIVQCYHRYITPHKTNIAIVGDLTGYDVPAVIQKHLGAWEGPEVEELQYPALKQLTHFDEPYQINRDQIVLCLAGLSVARKDPDFDKLLLFDQIFGAGVLGSLASRLFQLREETGLFYSINGSVVANASEQPGMVLIKTIVSLDRLKEAQDKINELITHVVQSVLPQEVDEAKRAILNALINNFETNISMAGSFLYLERFGFDSDYFDKRATTLMPITVAQVQEAVNKVLNNDKLVTLRIGRVA